MVYQSSALATTAAFQCSLKPHLTVPRSRGLMPSAVPVVLGAPTSPLCDIFSSSGSGFRRRRRTWLQANKFGNNSEGEEEKEPVDAKNPGSERGFLEEELARVESLEDILEELEALGGEGDEDDDFFLDEFDEETLEELFQSLPDEEDDDETYLEISRKRQSTSLLENALLQGVVAPEAGVGSNCLPGDFNFDPLDLASKDYFPQAQAFFRNLIPAVDGDESRMVKEEMEPRPKALILRDYREAEIRHGRLAMLAAVFWPLQEIVDRLVLDEEKFDSLLNSLFFGGITLPYFPLLMTFIMLLLGYLDIYSQAIKDVDKIGDAFQPGDCFWDPLQILTGAPDQMKRNMQERELFNGRFAMLAIAVFVYEEARTGKPIVSIPGNEILFEPAYQVPFIQKWLDIRFSSPSPVFSVYPYFSDEEIAGALSSVDIVFSRISDSITLNLH